MTESKSYSDKTKKYVSYHTFLDLMIRFSIAAQFP